jgi:hypothetical protein
MSESPSLTPEQKKIKTSLEWLEPLIKDYPEFCIGVAINYSILTKKYAVTDNVTLLSNVKNLFSGTFWNPIAAARGALHIRSVRTVENALLTNPALILENETSQNIAVNKNLWKGIKKEKDSIATFAFHILDFPEKQRKDVEKSISELLTILAKKVLSNPEQVKNLLRHTSVLLDPSKEAAAKKTTSLLALSDEVFKTKDLIEISTIPQLWELIVLKKEDIAGLIAPTLGLPKEQVEGTTKLISKLITDAAETIPANKELIHKMMEYTHVLIDPKEKDDNKMAHLFMLCDEAIKFAENSKGKFLHTLIENEETIKDILDHYIPAKIVKKTHITAEQITNIMLDNKTLGVLKEAYTRYKNSKYRSIGIIKAGATLIANKKIRGILINVAIRKFIDWLMTFVPDFMRRSHANKIVNARLKDRREVLMPGQTEDLLKLCTPKNIKDPIVHSTLKGCFKGLIVKANLNKLTIDEFNFQRATLGKQGETFSFAGSKILDSNFTGIKFEGKAIDLSGIEIDEKSFLTLLGSLKGKKLIINDKIKIITTQKTSLLEEKIKHTGLATKQIMIVPKLEIIKIRSFSNSLNALGLTKQHSLPNITQSRQKKVGHHKKKHALTS